MNSCSTNFTIRLVGSRIVYIPSNASSAPTIPTSAPRYAAMKTWRNSKTIAGGTEMSASRTKFYLDKQNAKWSGVCAGIADYSGIDVQDGRASCRERVCQYVELTVVVVSLTKTTRQK